MLILRLLLHTYANITTTTAQLHMLILRVLLQANATRQAKAHLLQKLACASQHCYHAHSHHSIRNYTQAHEQLLPLLLRQARCNKMHTPAATNDAHAHAHKPRDIGAHMMLNNLTKTQPIYLNIGARMIINYLTYTNLN